MDGNGVGAERVEEDETELAVGSLREAQPGVAQHDVDGASGILEIVK